MAVLGVGNVGVKDEETFHCVFCTIKIYQLYSTLNYCRKERGKKYFHGKGIGQDFSCLRNISNNLTNNPCATQKKLM